MVLEDHMQLPSRKIYVWQQANAFRTQSPSHSVATLHHICHQLNYFSLLREHALISFDVLYFSFWKAERSLYNYWCAHAGESSLCQSDIEGRVCFRGTTSSHRQPTKWRGLQECCGHLQPTALISNKKFWDATLQPHLSLFSFENNMLWKPQK